MNIEDVIQLIRFPWESVWEGFLTTVVACLAWYFLCQWLYRYADQRWRSALQAIDAAAGYDQRIAALGLARQIAAQGKPSDRLFLGGLCLAGSVGAVGMVYFIKF